MLVSKQHMLVGDGDHIVVERARSDGLIGLADEEGAFTESVAAGDRVARFDMLAGREGTARLAIHEYLDAAYAMIVAKPHVIGGALIAERRWDRAVDGEGGLVGEGET